MAKYLGTPSPFFPTIFNSNSNPAIYNVGPFESPLTDNSTTLVSISQAGWGAVHSVNGVNTQAVIAQDDSAKLYVATPNLTSLNLTYLDVGKDPVSVNVHNLDTQNWTNGYAVIQRNDTGKWRSFEFIVPTGEKGYVELGLHAFGENFTVSKIDAAPYQSQERPLLSSINGTIVNGTLNMELTNTTLPETMMVYLPIPNGTQTVQIETNSYGKQVCIEVFDGIIQPWETTDWWARHDLVTRSPPSVVYGAPDPSLVWNPEKAGYYTLVVVLRQYWMEDARVDISILAVIQSNATAAAQSQGSERIGHP
jgi:hypothetical protein